MKLNDNGLYGNEYGRCRNGFSTARAKYINLNEKKKKKTAKIHFIHTKQV